MISATCGLCCPWTVTFGGDGVTLRKSMIGHYKHFHKDQWLLFVLTGMSEREFMEWRTNLESGMISDARSATNT